MLKDLTLPKLFELDGLEVIHIIKSSINEKIGILIAKEKVNPITAYKPTIRLYLVERNDNSTEVTKELDALHFKTDEEAVIFSKRLSNLSATEYILSSNKIKL